MAELAASVGVLLQEAEDRWGVLRAKQSAAISNRDALEARARAKQAEYERAVAAQAAASADAPPSAEVAQLEKERLELQQVAPPSHRTHVHTPPHGSGTLRQAVRAQDAVIKQQIDMMRQLLCALQTMDAGHQDAPEATQAAAERIGTGG